METTQTELWRKRLKTPAYGVGEAAFYAKISPQTVAYWHKSRGEGGRVISKRAPRQGLSYLQLIEIAVVAIMRSKGVKLKNIRAARTYFARKFDVEYPFAQKKFKTDGVDILLDTNDPKGRLLKDRLVAANHGGQLLWTEMLSKRFREFNYDRTGIVSSWKVNGKDSEIVIDPQVAFGAPHIAGTPTWAIKERWVGGEGLGDISEDYSLPEAHVIDALKFEGVEIDRNRPNQWLP